MKITSKSRYAIKLMMDVALCEMKQERVKRADLARRQDIPLDYLDQILLKLRRAGLLESSRGRIGGYHLSQSAEDISVQNIFVAVEDQWNSVSCTSGDSICALEQTCLSQDAWQQITASIDSSLQNIKLSKLCSQSAHKHSVGIEIDESTLTTVNGERVRCS